MCCAHKQGVTVSLKEEASHCLMTGGTRVQGTDVFLDLCSVNCGLNSPPVSQNVKLGYTLKKCVEVTN